MSGYQSIPNMQYNNTLVSGYYCILRLVSVFDIKT